MQFEQQPLLPQPPALQTQQDLTNGNENQPTPSYSNQYQHQPTPFYIDNILGPSPGPSNNNSGNNNLINENVLNSSNDIVDATTDHQIGSRTPIPPTMSPTMHHGGSYQPPEDDPLCRANISHRAPMPNDVYSRPNQSTGPLVPTPIQAIPGNHGVIGFPPGSAPNYPRPNMMYDHPRLGNGFNTHHHLPGYAPASFGPSHGIYPGYPHHDYQAWFLERHAFSKSEFLFYFQDKK